MKQIQILFRYLSYLLEAGTSHDIHSPFLFDLYNDVIRNRIQDNDQKKVEDLRRSLLSRTDKIKIVELGAGSHLNKSRERQVGEFCKAVSKTPKYGRLLYRLSRHFKARNMLEFGTALGISGAYQALGNPSANILSLEGNPDCAKLARENFEQLGISNLKVIDGPFEESLPNALADMPRLDWVFLDGNHRKEPTLNYFRQVSAHLHEESIVILDDIHWSSEMETAWEEIKLDPKVSLSVDLFFMGLLFFRKDLSNEHRILRF